MDRSAQLEVFEAQTKNVRRLASARRQVKRAINHSLRRADAAAEEAHTLVLTLLYCAWLEASFLKLICTPHGFSEDEIEQIKRTQDEHGICDAWTKCIELGLRHVPAGPKSSDVLNIERRLKDLVNEFVHEPALVRNKIAHGQWEVALNRTRSAINTPLTEKLQLLDVVELDRWHTIAEGLIEIIEALIESPSRHFRGTYWSRLARLEETRNVMKRWTLQSRVNELRRKPVLPGAPTSAV